MNCNGNFCLKGKVAFVAGGAGYLGTPVCIKLAGQGATVMIADINKDRAFAAATEVADAVPGAKVGSVTMDASDEFAVRKAIADTVEKFGGLDIMVNATCAAIGKLVEEISPEEFDSALHGNLTSALFLARESAAAMKNGGSIVMFSSMYGRVSPDPRVYFAPMKPNPIEYGVAKAGIEQMVRYLAVYYGPKNIRVNGVCPGPFPNQNVPSYKADLDGFRSFVDRLAGKVPMGRVGKRHELAGPVTFLASDESSFVNGHILMVDGGWTAW